MKLIAIGDNVCDCYIDHDVFFPGGNCVNVAVHAKRNGAQEVNYVGVFGNDYMADYLESCLEKEGVTRHGSRKMYAATAQTGVKLVNGDRVFVGGNPNSCQRIVAMVMTNADLERAAQYDICHVSCYSSMESQLEKLNKVCPVAFDFSDIKDESYFNLVCPNITYAFLSASDISLEEAKALAQKLHSLGPQLVCLTRGKKGSLLYNGKEFYTQGIVPVSVVDTMGAGDSYIAAFLVNYAEGKGIEAAMAAAAEYAAHNCTKQGAIGYGHKMKAE